MGINLTAHALLFTIAAIGIAETAYLTKTRKHAEQPVCPIGGNCETVLNSKYNKVLGIHNDFLGLLFYLAFAVLLALLVIGVGDYSLWIQLAQLALLGATTMSFIFIYLQWNVIKAWCFWCLMSAGTIFLMDIIVLFSKTI